MRIASAKPLKTVLSKRIFEWLHNNKAGKNAVDDALMKITSRAADCEKPIGKAKRPRHNYGLRNRQTLCQT